MPPSCSSNPGRPTEWSGRGWLPVARLAFEIAVQVSGHRTGSPPVPCREPPPPRSWQECRDVAEPLERIQPIFVSALEASFYAAMPTPA
jgi:hypothetical protein